MAREIKKNRFSNAGKVFVEVKKQAVPIIEVTKPSSKLDVFKEKKKKNKVITAKVYPETWAEFTAINEAQGMTNNSAVNMIISDYVRKKKGILD